MIRDVLFPYRTIVGDVELRILDVSIDDQPFPKNPLIPDRRLMQLYDVDKRRWDHTRLEIELVGPAEELASLQERGDSLSATVVAHCTATNTRQSATLQATGSPPAIWRGALELPRANFRGGVALVGVITGSVSGAGSKMLGSSPQWTIHFDEPAIPSLEGTLRVQWVDFDSPGEHVFLAQYQDQFFYTDLLNSIPTVFLNKSEQFSGLSTLLGDHRRPNPWDRALHDSERVGIARSVWLAMLNAALAAIEDPSENGEDPDWPTVGWKRQVLEAVLPRLYPDKTPREALSCALEARNSKDGAAQLESQLEAAVGSLTGAGKLLRRGLLSLSRDLTVDIVG